MSLAAGKICHDSIVVSTSRCGRENPGSNPGHGRVVPSMANQLNFYVRAELSHLVNTM